MRSGIRLVLFLLVLAFVISMGGFLMIWLLVGAEPPVPSTATLVLRVSGDPGEGVPDDSFSQFLPVSRPPTVRSLVENIRKAKEDGRVRALVIKPTGLSSPYTAKLQELRDALLDFRRSGKPAIAHLEDGSQAAYYLATGCERIYLMPTSPLQVSGLATYELFLRGTLDKVGVYADMLHVGQYKTAVNTFTEKGFTPAHREMTTSLNKDAFDQLVAAIADARKKSEAEVRALLDQGPYLPEDAVRAGLVDDLAYEDQLSEKAKVPLHKAARLEDSDYSAVSAGSLGIGRGPRIAVLYATGTIVSGRSGYDPINGQVVGSDTLVESIRKIRENRDIRAVILRVDSPGGSATASDVIWRELVQMRDSQPDRPLVVSMSDLAASGGYYIAMAAPQIVAEPGTLTGSIGIFGGKIIMGGTYNKLGANVEVVSHGQHAEMNSPVRPYNPQERAKLGEQLQTFYDQFVEKAAASRHMDPERLDAVAQGRVWTGQQAKQVGLVDELGGLERALAIARQKANIPADSEVELIVYPPRRSVFDLLSGGWSGSEEATGLTSWLGLAGHRRALGILSAPATLFRPGEPLALMPFGILR